MRLFVSCVLNDKNRQAKTLTFDYHHDTKSLKNLAPSAVFLPSSPLNLTNNGDFKQNKTTTSASNSDQQQHQVPRTPLESIAEVTETATTITSAQGTGADDNETTSKKPSLHSTRSGPRPSKLEMPTPGAESRSGGESSPSALSPAFSEATTSIDLNSQTPASASILIADHNIKPTDKIASVLYFRQDKQEEHGLPARNKQQPGEPPRIGVSAEQPTHYNDHNNEAALQEQQQQPQNMLATDSLDSEEAAAIRIQSAFRGYRTRKNSPYRTRSPPSNSASTKQNALQQQGATVLQENKGDADDLGKCEQFETSEAAQTVGRRASRQRHRDSSPVQVVAVDDQRVGDQVSAEGSTRARERTIQGASSVEEFTTTEDTTTVKEAVLVPDQQQSDQAESNTVTPGQSVDQSAALEIVRSDEPNSDSRKADGPSLSFDINALSEANTLDEAGLSAALEAQETNTDDLPEIGGIANSLAPRPSEASVELDTDSSVLGAALSLNEDISASNDLQNASAQVGGSAPPLGPIDEDKSQGVSVMTDELESEARRLVDELNAEAIEEPNQDKAEELNCRLEEATNQLEQALDEATSGDVVEAHVDIAQELLDEEEQRAIELESDDIERRDPRGQASEERAKSPQIRTEEPEFISKPPEESNVPEIVGEEQPNDKQDEEVVEIVESEESSGTHLGLQPPDDGASSGRSSAQNSSSDADDNSENDNSPNKQQTSANRQSGQKQQQQPGKNKRKNRKRKGKK